MPYFSFSFNFPCNLTRIRLGDFEVGLQRNMVVVEIPGTPFIWQLFSNYNGNS